MILMIQARRWRKFCILCVQTVRGDDWVRRDVCNVIWSLLDRFWAQKLSKCHITGGCIKNTTRRLPTKWCDTCWWILPIITQFSFLTQKQSIQHVLSVQTVNVAQNHVFEWRFVTTSVNFYLNFPKNRDFVQAVHILCSGWIPRS